MRLAIVSAGLAAILLIGAISKDAATQSTPKREPTPLILEKTEGEHRVRRKRDTPAPTPNFTIKVDRQNGGSQKMWLATEEIPPGGVIARHKHMGQDEILLLQTGMAHAWLGDQERDVHAGAVVFIPSGTWISMKNIGRENISLTFVFSEPGFDDFMRCVSVPAGEESSKLTPEEFKACQHEGHVMFEAPSRKPSH
ncbi:MAG TPA: cupin domain-containing protein [Candidatus Sulfotelmatobacter sp.]|jgi:mannose-6-phosphate isomerase-like protein (cupin superfamily)